MIKKTNKHIVKLMLMHEMSAFRLSTLALTSLFRVLKKYNFKVFYFGLMDLIHEYSIGIDLEEVNRCLSIVEENEVINELLVEEVKEVAPVSAASATSPEY